MQLRSMLACALALAANFAQARDYHFKDLHIGHPYARATVSQQAAGAAYLSVENNGKAADRLVGAESPVAKSVEFHTMSMEGNVMKMREVPSIELKPAEKIDMTPGNGYHLMMHGLRQPLKAGDKFPMTLNFEKAGKTEVLVYVEDPKKPAQEAVQHQH